MMTHYLWALPSFMSILGMFAFVSARKHLLCMMLSLEMIVLSLFLLLFNVSVFFSSESYFCVVFLTLGVCEGALGLSILVCMSRTHGNDNFQSLNIL